METTRPINGTCPECRGPLSETVQTNDDSALREYKCLVGHVYSPRALLEAHSETQERALWSAVVALEESATLVQCVSSEFPPEIVERLQEQARIKEQQAQRLREVLDQLEP